MRNIESMVLSEKVELIAKPGFKVNDKLMLSVGYDLNKSELMMLAKLKSVDTANLARLISDEGECNVYDLLMINYGLLTSLSNDEISKLNLDMSVAERNVLLSSIGHDGTQAQRLNSDCDHDLGECAAMDLMIENNTVDIELNHIINGYNCFDTKISRILKLFPVSEMQTFAVYDNAFANEEVAEQVLEYYRLLQTATTYLKVLCVAVANQANKNLSTIMDCVEGEDDYNRILPTENAREDSENTFFKMVGVSPSDC